MSSRSSWQRVAVGVGDQPLDLLVDDAAGLVAEPQLLAVGAVDQLSQPLREPELGDGAAGEHVHLLQVVGGPGGDLADQQLLGGAAGQDADHLLVDEAAGVQRAVRLPVDGEAGGLTAGADGDPLRLVLGLAQLGGQHVACLVPGHQLALLVAHRLAGSLRPRQRAQVALAQILVGDRGVLGAGGDDRGLVEHVGELGAGRAGGVFGQVVELDVLGQRLVFGVEAEDGQPPVPVGRVDADLHAEPAGAEQGGVEQVEAVGGRDADQTAAAAEAVQLHQQGVQRVLGLLVGACGGVTGPSPSDGVDLVDEDDGALLALAGAGEQLPDPLGADADVHLDEVGSAGGEERDARLAGDGLGQQRLAGARRPVEDEAARHLGPQRLEPLGRAQEVECVGQLQHGLVTSGHVSERDGGRLLLDGRGGGSLPLAAARLHRGEDDAGHDQPEQAQRQDQRPAGRAAARRGAVHRPALHRSHGDLGAGLRQQLRELGVGRRVRDRMAGAVGQRHLDAAVDVVEHCAAHLVIVRSLDQLRVSKLGNILGSDRGGGRDEEGGGREQYRYRARAGHLPLVVRAGHVLVPRSADTARRIWGRSPPPGP
jgi:hypothetical protein